MKRKSRSSSASSGSEKEGAIDLCESDGGADENPRYRGYETYAVGSPLNDAKLRGEGKLVTLETARQAIHLVAQFRKDEAAGNASVTFSRSLFDPLWQRLKEQGGKHGRWRYERCRDKLSPRSWAFVPPRSASGTSGTLGEDFFLSEEHVALSVLGECAMKGVSDLYSQNAHHFVGMLEILERAVEENIEYNDARMDGKRPRRSRSCNFQRYGIDLDLVRFSDESSVDEKSHQDECFICGDGGELICCDKCDKAYHADCLRVKPEDLPEQWHCPSCLPKDKDSAKSFSNRQTKSVQDDSDLNFDSNLSGVEPKVNMPVDILDESYVWNVGRIVQVSYRKGKRQGQWTPGKPPPVCRVTIHYEGWPDEEHNETMPYPNKRLARIFTYTKKAKCFGTLLNRSKRAKGNATNDSTRNWIDVWPCKATFRMPHPNNSSASNYLREETRVFVQPYMANCQSAKRELVHGGMWVRGNEVLPWEELNLDVSTTTPARNRIVYEDKEYDVADGFCQAYQTAQTDWIKGKLPPGILLEGALLNDQHRVQNVGGDVIDGVKYSGAFRSKNGEPIPPLNCPWAAEDSFSPAELPPQVYITDNTIPNQCTRRLPDSNRWAGILRVAGNDIFLGSYQSQSEAAYAVKAASAKAMKPNDHQTAKTTRDEEDSTLGSNIAKIDGLFSTSIDSVVASFEKARQSNTPRGQFKLQDWMARHQMNGQDVNNRNECHSSGNRRMKAVPKRFHK